MFIIRLAPPSHQFCSWPTSSMCFSHQITNTLNWWALCSSIIILFWAILQLIVVHLQSTLPFKLMQDVYIVQTGLWLCPCAHNIVLTTTINLINDCQAISIHFLSAFHQVCDYSPCTLVYPLRVVPFPFVCKKQEYCRCAQDTAGGVTKWGGLNKWEIRQYLEHLDKLWRYQQLLFLIALCCICPRGLALLAFSCSCMNLNLWLTHTNLYFCLLNSP